MHETEYNFHQYIDGIALDQKRFRRSSMVGINVSLIVANFLYVVERSLLKRISVDHFLAGLNFAECLVFVSYGSGVAFCLVRVRRS